MNGKIILREAEGYFTTKKTAKDLQSFLRMTDDSLLGWRLRAVSEMHDHNGLDAVPKVLQGDDPPGIPAPILGAHSMCSPGLTWIPLGSLLVVQIPCGCRSAPESLQDLHW